MSGSMRLLDERHVASKVELMVWSNKMDLLALSNVRGEVALHRLSWQRVWSLSPPQEGSTVRAMAWRPDGKVIAVAYSSREVLLVDVENKETLHTTIMDSDISCLSWVQEQDSNKNQSVNASPLEKARLTSNILPQENASNFLPKLPSLSRSFGVNKLNNEENLEDTKRIRDQTHLNILLVGLVTGKLNISVFGLFPCGSIDLQPYMEQAGCDSCGAVLDAAVSDDLKVMFIVVAHEKPNHEAGKEVRVIILDTPMLASHSRELYTLALKQGHISSLQGYLSSTMQAITEAWESILLEMDSKLATYAATVADGSVAADFLDLLMLGVPSPELELFLQRDLTEKGLKKLSHSIELSYSNIQKLVLKHIHCVGTNLSFHLTELRGMARHMERYSPLGLKEDTVAESLRAAGSFLVKATEVQQVIDNSMKKYKAFFRWLFLAILRLTDERVPPEITKGTQQDLSFIAEFLCNFDGPPEMNRTLAADVKPENKTSTPTNETVSGKGSNGAGASVTTRKSRFNLERLGQYLVDQDLNFLPESDSNPWNKLLAENPQLSEHNLIIPHFRKMSLVQQHHHLTTAIDAVFREPAECIGRAFSLQRVIRLPDSSLSLPLYYSAENSSNRGTSRLFRVTCVHCPTDKKLLIAYPNNETSLHLLELPTHIPASQIQVPMQQLCLCFNHPLPSNPESGTANTSAGQHLKVLDMQFFVADILSLLLEKRGEDRSAIFIQFPRKVTRDITVTVSGANNAYRDVAPAEASCLLEPGSLRAVDNFVACRLAVTGSRNVGVVLSENRCKVRLFEMEAEEEEEEDETMDATSSTVRDSDQSHMLDHSKSSELDE